MISITYCDSFTYTIRSLPDLGAKCKEDSFSKLLVCINTAHFFTLVNLINPALSDLFENHEKDK